MTGAVRQPVMDQHIFYHLHLNQLEGRFGGTSSVPLGRRGLGSAPITTSCGSSRGHAGNGVLDDGQHELLYAAAITTYFDARSGSAAISIRRPTRNWAAFGIEGLAPLFFRVARTGYVSGEGHLAAKLEATYDLLLTQRLILQPQIELNFYTKADPARHVGAGLSDIDAGLRLRYEISRKFAPYVGVTYDGKFGGTADFARAAGHATERSASRLACGHGFEPVLAEAECRVLKPSCSQLRLDAAACNTIRRKR